MLHCLERLLFEHPKFRGPHRQSDIARQSLPLMNRTDLQKYVNDTACVLWHNMLYAQKPVDVKDLFDCLA